MHHSLKKLIRSVILLMPVLFLPFLSSRSDEWVEEDGSWKYRYDDGSFETGGWKWDKTQAFPMKAARPP